VSTDETSQAGLPPHGVYDAFAGVAARLPDAPALLGDDLRLSYGDLAARATRLAAALRTAGVGRGDHVALYAGRGAEAVTAMLACLRLGAVYAPMDPDFAPEQLGFIAADLPLAAALCPSAMADACRALIGEAAPVLVIGEAEGAPEGGWPEVGPEDAACVLYTSGTTGRPKGVVLPHRAITAMALCQPALAMSPADVCLHAATIACDGALHEIFLPLLSGAAIAIVETTTASLDAVAGVLARHGVTVAPWYAGLHHLMIEHRIEAFATVRLSISGGDVMSAPLAARLLEAWPGLTLLNAYGPTETCVQSLIREVTLDDARSGAIPLGVALPLEEALLLDDDLRPVAEGETGQLAIAGAKVALGYHGRPERTAQSFVPDPREGRDGLIYLTGDLARRCADGVHEFAGRADRQVKLAGRRVEIDGVEHVLRGLPGVADAVVELVKTPAARLAAFVIPEAAPADPARFVAALKEAAAADLSREVIPREVHLLDAFPLTPAGKVDRKALRTRLDTAAPVAPAARPADALRAISGVWQAVLGCAAPRASDTFFDLGGTSLQLIEAHARIESALSRRFDIALMFETPRLGDLAARLSAIDPAPDTAEAAAPEADDGAVAIIGLAARLPGVETLEDFWQVLRAGRSTIARFDPAEAEDIFDHATRTLSTYVPARSILSEPEMFDAKFFDMRPREAAETDPQGRIFLEVCQQALDDAGVDPARAGGPVGLYAGASMSTYLLENLLADRAAQRRFTTGFQLDYTLLGGNDSDGIATRVAYKLGLTGPAMSVNTACSTSLVTVAQAVQALRAGMSRVVLAGGVSVTFPQKRGYLYQEGGMASPDGLCRPFDAAAGGTVFGHGAGVVVLKRLKDALADGDRIRAVIRGVGLNNDGAAKMSYTAPSVAGQAEAIRMAHRDAGIDAAQIGYMECHGTATPLGDPVEIAGLKSAFATAEGRCALGSVKGNIGHLDAAAGVTSVIKTVLMLERREIPPVAHFRALNPRIDLDGSAFYVPQGAGAWESDGPRLAGISSFGVGGTNAHVVIGEAPVAEAEAAPEGIALLPISARAPEALEQMAQELADHLEATDPPLADVAFTLQEGRRTHEYRLGLAASDRADAIAQLRAAKAPKAPAGAAPEVVFLFPGQGSQYPGMGAGLYEAAPDYARWIDRGTEILTPILGRDIRRLILGQDLSQEEAAQALRETWITQPALFLTEYATAKLWQARGIEPAAMIGHSVGEFAAAALAGVMSFEDALTLIAKRGRLMMDQPGGAMLSVRAPLDDLLPHLDDTTDLAAKNAPKLQVVAGPFAAIDALAARLDAAGIANQRLHTSHAFHSRMMNPVTEALHAAAQAITLNAPATPIVSAVTGSTLSDAEATDPAYWAGQARACVDFQAALVAVAETRSPVFVEVGPGRTLSAFAAQTLSRGSHLGVIQSLPDHARSVPDMNAMAAAATSLWAGGIPVDWSRQGPRGRRKVPLPAYPFQRQRHWIDPPEAGAAPAAAVPPTPLSQPVSTHEVPAMIATPVAADRRPRLVSELADLLAEMSGEEIAASDAGTSFLEFGFDSLFMGQVSQALSRQYGVDIGFRRLLSDLATLDDLAAHLDAQMPAEAAPEPVAAAPATAATPAAPAQPVAPVAMPQAAPVGAGVEGLLQAQLQTMQAVFAQQLQALGSGAAPQAAAPVAQPAPAPQPAPAAAPAASAAPAPKAANDDEADAQPKGFKVGRGPNVQGGTMTAEQTAFARDLAARYAAKHAKSKAHTAQYRDVHADPRTAAGFRAEWKELVFPIVADRSKGAWIHDLDGNDFVDLVNGFGQTAFGHSPDFVVEAVAKQMEKGFPIGPQADLAGPVAEKFAKWVGHERVTFCNTGSEAVMAAMRVARTVTGRDLVVVFDRDYHGQFDEVLVKGRSKPGDPRPLPIAPGIPRSGIANMIVLPYGAETATSWLRENINDVAAVIVEPVQSRHPEHRPEAFVRELREITKAHGAALVIDEVVTGFRTSKRGMQGVWGIQGDMATYGKVVGGGMPIGVLAGDARFMDALDGGTWAYGDESRPEKVPTFFAGTFVRHPLVLAAVDASLDYMEREGDKLWTEAAARCEALAGKLKHAMTSRGLPDLIEQYSSWFVINTTEADPRATLLYPLMRMEGVHVMDGFCGFLTTEHGEAECARVLAAFETALDALLSVGILADLRSKDAPALPAPAPLAPAKAVPLTESQREIWMSHQMGGAAAAAFNECGSLALEGELDADALQAAWDGLIARHDALRLRFARDGSSFDVTESAPLELARLDLSGEADPQAALDALIAEEGEIPFDITAEPPLRGTLVRLGETSNVLVMTMHHIVADGWSFGVMLDDLAALYAARVEGRQADLPPAPSFAAHARTAAAKVPNGAVMDFWKGMYETIPALPDMPVDRPRPERKSYAGGTVFHQLSPEALKAAKRMGGKHGCTLFATTFTAMQVLISRLSGARDIVLGVPTAEQQTLPNPDLVGHCVNFLPVRAPMEEGASVASHMQAVRDRMMAAFDHQDTTFGAIVRELNVPRRLDRLPLTEIEFNLEKDSAMAAMPGLTVGFRPNAKRAVNFDLFFNLAETAEGLRIDAHYNADLFDEATVRGWTRAYETVLSEMVADPEQPVDSVPMVAEDDRLTIGAKVNATARAYDRHATLTDLFDRAVAAHADAVAVEDASGTLTYAALAAQSDALAALIQSRVPGKGARIALCLPRGAEMLAGLIAVMKAGHTYVPLDPRQPAARLASICETAEVAAILTDSAGTAGFADGSGLPLILTGEAPEGATPEAVQVSPEQAAYVIFTSGSTGTPKGVAVPHRAVVNFLTSMAAEPGLSASDTLLAVTTVMFDIAVLELFLPLTQGARVVIATTEDVIDGFRLVERLKRGDVTVMQATPTLWDMVLTAGFTPARGFRMLCGGEPLPADLAQRLTAEGAELWNMYGPTETTIWSAVKRVEPGQPITIGHPIANTELHILDAAGRIAPLGATGELNIGGDGLALGYYNRDDLTAKAFRSVSFGGAPRKLYATGDLARRREDGEIEVLGRIDTQVKLRGFRIELGEIETRLRAIPGVAKAAVDLRARGTGDRQLVGYVVPQDGQDPQPQALAEALAQDLPDYMIPRAWVALSSLPQTGNGKLDRKALPDPAESASVTPLHGQVAPETETEKRIAEIWGKVLGHDDIGVTDTLFTLGVDSLAVFRIAAQMLDAGLNLEARDMFAHPSIRQLAAFHDSRGDEAARPARPSLKDFRHGARRAERRPAE